MSNGDDKLRDASAGMLELMAKVEQHRDRYSHSSLSLYAGCPTRYYYGQVEGLEPIQGAPVHDLLYGSAMHEALAAYYDPKNTFAASGKVKPQAREVFAAAYPRETFPYQLPHWSLGKTYDNALNALDSYARHWGQDDRHWEVLEVEMLDDVRDQAETSRVLKLDLVVRDHRDNLIYAVDHKVTGKYLDDWYWKQFEPHSQIRQYATHIKQKYGNFGGFIINAITCKMRSKAVTPRTGPNKGVYQAAGAWHDFARMLFNPTAEAIEMEMRSVDYWVARIEQDKATGTWGYNTGDCHRGGGDCEYLSLCGPGITWPKDEEYVRLYYRQSCRAVMDDDKGRRCQLDRGHEGAHDSTPRIITPDPAGQDYEFEGDEVNGATPVEMAEAGEDGWIVEGEK